MEKKEIRIELDNIYKKFNRGYKKNESILSRLSSFISGKESREEFWVLKNISIKARAGENIGIIGRNGSGKSTLLRIIAGIYIHNKGTIKTQGEIVYLTGFGQGLKPKLTMRENIYLIGSIMGLSQKHIKEKFNEIVEFSGLKNYVDAKVYQFSSGMITRLNFSIGIHCVLHKNPEVLLIDEAIGAGADIDFQEKALKKMEELLQGGATVILVSHSLEQIKKYCDKVIWLENGEIKKYGEPEVVVGEYRES